MLLVAMETGVSSGRVKLKNMRNMEKSIILYKDVFHLRFFFKNAEQIRIASI